MTAGRAAGMAAVRADEAGGRSGGSHAHVPEDPRDTGIRGIMGVKTTGSHDPDVTPWKRSPEGRLRQALDREHRRRRWRLVIHQLDHQFVAHRRERQLTVIAKHPNSTRLARDAR